MGQMAWMWLKYHKNGQMCVLCVESVGFFGVRVTLVFLANCVIFERVHV